MFQLLELILVSPIGALLMNAIDRTAYVALSISDCEECGFNDLGKLMLAGVMLAILLGVGISLWHWRRKQGRAERPDFISIRQTRRDR